MLAYGNCPMGCGPVPAKLTGQIAAGEELHSRSRGWPGGRPYVKLGIHPARDGSRCLGSATQDLALPLAAPTSAQALALQRQTEDYTLF
jgi:hypothetical protein